MHQCVVEGSKKIDRNFVCTVSFDDSGIIHRVPEIVRPSSMFGVGYASLGTDDRVFGGFFGLRAGSDLKGSTISIFWS